MGLFLEECRAMLEKCSSSFQSIFPRSIVREASRLFVFPVSDKRADTTT